MKQFTGQGVEKSNDDIKLIYHRRTNKYSAIAESLLVWHMEIFVNAVC
jgi:hypothetical protein